MSEPQEDSVYPDVGDPGVDALHYDLDLSWDPEAERAHRRPRPLLLRATRDADHLQLDLARQLSVDHVWLDGRSVSFSHRAKDLVVEAPVTAGDRHVLQLTYAGTPEPVAAPTDRGDFSTTGWTTHRRRQRLDDAGAVRRLLLVRRERPAVRQGVLRPHHRRPEGPWSGSPTARSVSRKTVGGRTVTHWHLPEPAASYLITIAIGRLHRDHGHRSARPADHLLDADATGPSWCKSLRYAPRGDRLPRAEGRPLPVPDASGCSSYPANSAMETQSMVTLGDNQLHALARRARPRDRAPVVRRRGHPGRLERPVDERGDGDVPRRGELDRRPRPARPRPTILQRVVDVRRRHAQRSTARRPTTGPGRSARATPTTSPR